MASITSASPGKLSVERVFAPGRVAFERDYLSPPGRPVILTNVVTTWPAFGKWSFSFLSGNFGDTGIVAMDQLFAPKKAFKMRLRTFLKYCEDPSLLAERAAGSPLYFGFQPFCRECSLLNDFTWPEECNNLYADLGDEIYEWYLRHFGVLLIGPAGTVTPTHADLFGTHAWLAQLWGSKKFVFEPPDRHREPSTDDLPPNLQYEAVVHAGDLIVFPQGWRHNVTSLTASISLSFNFVNHTNYAAHLLEICRDLPAWMRRLDSPALRKALNITWKSDDFRTSRSDQRD